MSYIKLLKLPLPKGMHKNRRKLSCALQYVDDTSSLHADNLKGVQKKLACSSEDLYENNSVGYRQDEKMNIGSHVNN